MSMTVLKDCLYGILVIIAVVGFNLGINLYYGGYAGLNPEQYAQYINKGLLLTALPAALVTFLLTALFRTKSKEAALQRSITWTVMVAVVYIIFGLANNNFHAFFGNRGIYTLLLCTFNGPILYAVIRRLEGSLL